MEGVMGETVVGVDLASADSISGMAVLDEAGGVADSLWGAETIVGGDTLAVVGAALAAGDTAALAAPQYTHTQVVLGGPAGEWVGQQSTLPPLPQLVAGPGELAPIPVVEGTGFGGSRVVGVAEWVAELDRRLREVECVVGIRPRDPVPDPALADGADSLVGDVG
jgi:hypothetical protein